MALYIHYQAREAVDTFHLFIYILYNCSVIKVRKVRGFFECGRLTLLLQATEILTLSRVTRQYATCTYNLIFPYFDNDTLLLAVIIYLKQQVFGNIF